MVIVGMGLVYAIYPGIAPGTTGTQGLEAKVQNVGVELGTLKEPAGQLASAAGNLAKNDLPKASANADTVIDKYNTLEDELNSKPDEKAKLEKEFKTVKHIYDRMLNVTKAKNLKGQVGNGRSDEKIWHKAKELYTKANDLARAPGVSTNAVLKNLATDLANAVGKDDSKGLRKALKELSTAGENDKVEKALAVINDYNAVKSAYDKVKAKQDEYKGADATTEYDDVTSAFEALEEAYKLGQCKAIVPIYDKEC